MNSWRTALPAALILAAGCRQIGADRIKPSTVSAVRDDLPCAPELPGVVYHCGELVVPGRRDSLGRRAGPRSITLPLVALPATRLPRQADPIIYLTGGPGTSALLQVATYQEGGSDRDFIVMEERGNGYSKLLAGDHEIVPGQPRVRLTAGSRLHRLHAADRVRGTPKPGAGREAKERGAGRLPFC